MKTYKEFNSYEEVIWHLKKIFPKDEYFKIEKYIDEPDERIGWSHTKIISVSHDNETFWPVAFCCNEDGYYEKK
jgi:hypothetical protein